MVRLLLLWTALIVAGVGAVAFSHVSHDPLTQLERATRELPSYGAAVEGSEDNNFYWSAWRVQRILESQMGVTVQYDSPGLEGAAGMTIPSTRHIFIDPAQHWTTRFETLVHEAAHLLQPHLDLPADREMFAESVSYMVAIHDGDHGALGRSSRYLSGVKNSLHILRDYRAEILRAAQFLE